MFHPPSRTLLHCQACSPWTAAINSPAQPIQRPTSSSNPNSNPTQPNPTQTSPNPKSQTNPTHPKPAAGHGPGVPRVHNQRRRAPPVQLPPARDRLPALRCGAPGVGVGVGVGAGGLAAAAGSGGGRARGAALFGERLGLAVWARSLEAPWSAPPLPPVQPSFGPVKPDSKPNPTPRLGGGAQPLQGQAGHEVGRRGAGGGGGEGANWGQRGLVWTEGFGGGSGAPSAGRCCSEEGEQMSKQ